MQKALAELSKEELIEQLLTQQQHLAEKEQLLARLEHRNAELWRLIRGVKSERYKAAQQDPNQLTLDLGQAMETAKEEVKKEEIAYTREKKSRKGKPVRTEIPATYPREEITLEPDGVTEDMKRIGEEVTEELEYVPGKLIVRRIIRPKYAQPQPDGSTRILIAELPSRPIDKGMAGPGLLTKVIIDKYADHLPVYRQAQRFKREGITLADSTLYDWIARCCHLMEPLYDVLRQKVVQSRYVQADETPIAVLSKDKPGSTHTGYLWVYHAPREHIAFFDYRRSRGKAGPLHILTGYKGWLQTDGYAAYDSFEQEKDISLVGCLAHVRRKFEHALKYDKENADHVLRLIQQLYAIERQAREQSLNPDERRALREEKCVSVMQELGTWLRDMYPTFLPKSPLGDATAYALSRLEYCARYLLDGSLEIDNNLIENLIRPVAIGRKNYLFAGSHEGGKRAAMIYSFMATCKLNGIDPFAWLRDTLTRLPDHPVKRLEELLPVKK
jgi:transposase